MISNVAVLVVLMVQRNRIHYSSACVTMVAFSHCRNFLPSSWSETSPMWPVTVWPASTCVTCSDVTRPLAPSPTPSGTYARRSWSRGHSTVAREIQVGLVVGVFYNYLVELLLNNIWYIIQNIQKIYISNIQKNICIQYP